MSSTGPLSPRFWAAPITYIRWAARERPAYFWSVVVGATGPVMLVTVPPIRRWMGAVPEAPVPMTYPVPTTPRKQLKGYDDDTETN